MFIRKSHIVPTDAPTCRLSDYVEKVFPQFPSRKSIKKTIKKGGIRVNGVPGTTGQWIQAGQLIEWLDLEENPPKAYTMSLDIIYEDTHLAILHKPAGIIVSGNQYRTIQNAIVHQLSPSSEIDVLKWPRPVHRLDKATSGLLLIAKTAAALIQLNHYFENKQIRKTYLAIVVGQIEEKGIINQPIEGKTAITHFKRLQIVPSLKNQFLSLVELSPITGRTHQLRIHLSQMNHPIMGDQLYGPEGQVFKGKGLFLAAVGLQFQHPFTTEIIAYRIPAPAKFASLMNREKRRWEKYK